MFEQKQQIVGGGTETLIKLEKQTFLLWYAFLAQRPVGI